MMDDTNSADGTAVKLLLAGLVLASASVGALGLTDLTSHASTPDVAGGQAPRLLFPIDNATDAFGNALAVDGSARLAFPIDNVTATGLRSPDTDRYALRRGVDPYLLALRVTPGVPGQDMDPY
jgi:hypothetical protein